MMLPQQTNCLMAVNKWMMSNNCLRLYEDKTFVQNEILLVGPKTKREKLSSNLGKFASLIKPEVTRVGVVLEPDLNLKSHINKVTTTSFFYLHNIARVQPFFKSKRS